MKKNKIKEEINKINKREDFDNLKEKLSRYKNLSYKNILIIKTIPSIKT